MALNLRARLVSYLQPLLFYAIAFYGAILVFLEAITFRLEPAKIFSLQNVRSRIFSKLWFRISGMIKAGELETILPKLEAQASGIVLEVGPGSGNQLSRYDVSKIKKIYGIEPNLELHDELRKTIKGCGLSDQYAIVPCGVEDFGTLKMYGVKPESVDTILVVSVLCSVPRPKQMTKALYKLLKPGGQMIVHEHVKSHDPMSGLVQQFYNILWPFVFGNCHLTRPTGQYLLEAGEWAEVDLQGIGDQDATHVLPKVIGRLIKEY